MLRKVPKSPIDWKIWNPVDTRSYLIGNHVWFRWHSQSSLCSKHQPPWCRMMCWGGSSTAGVAGMIYKQALWTAWRHQWKGGWGERWTRSWAICPTSSVVGWESTEHLQPLLHPHHMLDSELELELCNNSQLLSHRHPQMFTSNIYRGHTYSNIFHIDSVKYTNNSQKIWPNPLYEIILLK